MADMDAIRALVGCGASGKGLEPGTIYRVPDEVSLDDAHILVRLGKAEAVFVPSPPARERKKKADTDAA